MKESSTVLNGLSSNRRSKERAAERPAKACESSGPALDIVERLEAACHKFILHLDQDAARDELKQALRLDAGNRLDTVAPLLPIPMSSVASLATVAAVHKASIVALLANKRTSKLELRVAVARFCQTLTSMRGLMSGGRRLVAGGPRLVT